ncbi:MAG TPA: A/G-specific adenine glycosylase [Acidimicrobiales bacterium]|nr:A/G-specific adenine glycosylase [Acidimicrobiales bacterium]
MEGGGGADAAAAVRRGRLGVALLDWWDEAGRDLPWRRTRDPWAVLVSELMLQQTQVPRVVPKYTAFVDRFPTPASCAAAPVGDVVRLWSGLGYNRRAVNLHRCATAAVERHDGRLPDSLDDLLALPGIGPYTARAVLAFAFERDVGVLDVNAARVLGRAWSVTTQADADAVVPPGSGWAWNQAVLDLGATRLHSAGAPLRGLPVGRRLPLARRRRSRPSAAGRQSRFEGSERQGRGRLVAALAAGPVPLDGIDVAAGWPGESARAQAALDSLVADGLAVVRDGAGRLP